MLCPTLTLYGSGSQPRGRATAANVSDEAAARDQGDAAF